MAKKKFKHIPGYRKKKKRVLGSHASPAQQNILQQALVHHQAGRFLQAESLYAQILKAKPNHPEALNYLGMLAHDTGNIKMAIELIHKAINSRPDYVEAYLNLGFVLLVQGKTDEAITIYQRLLTIKPDHAEAHYNLGIAFKKQGDLDAAIASNRRAVTLKPDYAFAYFNLGTVLEEKGELDEALANYYRTINLKPDYIDAQSKLLYCLNYSANYSIAKYLEEAQRYGRNVTDKVRRQFTTWICSKNPNRLRVGIVSGDIRNHPVGYFLENVLEQIDHARMEFVAFPTHQFEDELTVRLKPHFVTWKPLQGRNDEAAASLIYEEGANVLLDLSGHTQHNRLPVFAWKPSPIQATWLGYFASTGINEIDYLITDPVSVPESHQKQFTEKVWYLPDIRICFSVPVLDEESTVSSLPALHKGHITFGSFQNVIKINEKVLAAWGVILQALPEARLRLQNHKFNSKEMQKQFYEKLSHSGIKPERVMLEKSVPRKEYFAAHSYIDIILDTFPFPGGTTTCEALWMGVPTLTLAGNTMLARQGASLLSSAGLTDWIAKDTEDYVAKVIAHATDFNKLEKLRAGLRQQVLASPLFDGPRFARNFEAAMWGMWHKYSEEH